MAYSSPRTWTTDEEVTAAMLNQEIRDNIGAIAPVGAAAWTDYTPTLTQSATVSKTITYARYMKVGRMVTVNVLLTCTSSGTAANHIEVGLPLAAVSSAAFVVGTFHVYNSSGPNHFVGACYFWSTTSVACVTNNNSHYLGETSSAFASAIGSGDIVSISLTYESAS